MLQPGRYWPEFCRLAGREDLIGDERFDSTEKLMANAGEAAQIVADEIAARPFAHWVDVLGQGEGQWAAVQNAWEVGQDPSLRANGLIAAVVDAEGVDRELVASPVQFDEQPVALTRAPQFAEHTDEVLRGLDITEDELTALKIEGAVT